MAVSRVTVAWCPIDRWYVEKEYIGEPCPSAGCGQILEKQEGYICDYPSYPFPGEIECGMFHFSKTTLNECTHDTYY